VCKHDKTHFDNSKIPYYKGKDIECFCKLLGNRAVFKSELKEICPDGKAYN